MSVNGKETSGSGDASDDEFPLPPTRDSPPIDAEVLELEPAHNYKAKPLTVRDVLSWRRLQLSRAKLKAASRTSALLSGFAVVVMVELEISGGAQQLRSSEGQLVQTPPAVPEWLLVLFASSAALLIAVHMMALMISTCLLPNLECVNGEDARTIRASPHDKMRLYIEMSWIFSTGLGILLFLVVVVLQTWVKFYALSKRSAIAATGIITPVVIVFVAFALAFYHQLTLHTFRRAALVVERLQFDLRTFDQPGDAMAV